MGDNRGPHDGTALVESGLDFFLLQNRGRAVVKSAGNEGATNRHAQVPVPPNGTADVTFKVSPNDTSDRHIEMWYSRDDALTLTLRAPVPAGGGARLSSAPVGPNSGPVTFLANGAGAPIARQVTATIDSRDNDPRNGASVIDVDLTTNSTLPTPKAPLLEGEWQIHFDNVLGRAATVDLYIDNGKDAPSFTSNATRAGSLTTPGTAKLVATVGAYAQKSFLFFNWSGDLTSFSSFGPTRDGDAKPNVSAPGSKVTSVKTKARQHCCCNCCFSFYTDTTEGGDEFQGTSMAAPHVTGAIALMFEKNPSLHAQEILQILRDTARAPEVGHGVLPDSQWGAGRVSALGAVNRVTGPVPGPNMLDAGGSAVVPAIARIGSNARIPVKGLTTGRRPIAIEIGDGRDRRAWSGPAHAVLQTSAGQRCAALVSRHFSEVRGLINHNRRVATRWHQMGGPQLLNTLAPALAGSGVLTIQNAHALAAWRHRMRQFLEVLERFGSPALAADVRAHRQPLLTFGVDDILALVSPLSLA